MRNYMCGVEGEGDTGCNKTFSLTTSDEDYEGIRYCPFCGNSDTLYIQS